MNVSVWPISKTRRRGPECRVLWKLLEFWKPATASPCVALDEDDFDLAARGEDFRDGGRTSQMGREAVQKMSLCGPAGRVLLK